MLFPGRKRPYFVIEVVHGTTVGKAVERVFREDDVGLQKREWEK